MWEKELKVAVQAARDAGEILRRSFGQVNRVMKKGDIDLVTDADLQAERTILGIIGSNFPKDNILAEETGAHDHVSDRTWLVDPLDGTTNFAHRFPFYAVSIGLEVEKEVVLGVVYNPQTKEFFEGVTGRGAFLNKNPIKVSETRLLSESLIGTGFPYDVHENPRRVMALFEKILVTSQGIRRPGAAAIDLCYLAAGRFDGFWEEQLKPWDTAAGIIILKEAGGKFSTISGKPYTPYEDSIVAANPFIHEEMIKVLNS
jgi:myo-inositol-1(or 4)-monophosphatase